MGIPGAGFGLGGRALPGWPGPAQHNLNWFFYALLRIVIFLACDSSRRVRFLWACRSCGVDSQDSLHRLSSIVHCVAGKRKTASGLSIPRSARVATNTLLDVVPGTLSEDGDPLDVLVLNEQKLISG